MADLSPGVALARQLDARYSQRIDQISEARQARDAASTETANQARTAEQAAQARATQTTDNARKIDEEQRLREQQQAAELRRLDQRRQDYAASLNQQTQQAAEPQARGAIVDLFA